MKLQKIGGYSAIAAICAYVVSAYIYNRFGLHGDPVQAMDAYSAVPVLSSAGLLFLTAAYILCLVYFLALHERMHVDAPYLTRVMLIAASVAAAFGIIETIVWVKGMQQIAPTRDVSAYNAFNAIFLGLHNADAHAIGWAILFGGWAILKTRAFSRILGSLSLAAGLLWIPAFIISHIADIATYLLCAASIWIGIELLRKKSILSTDRKIAAAS